MYHNQRQQVRFVRLINTCRGKGDKVTFVLSNIAFFVVLNLRPLSW